MASRLAGLVALGTAAAATADQVAAAATAIRTSAAEIAGHLERVSSASTATTEKVLGETYALKDQVATALDDILNQLAEGSGFQDEIRRQIEGVKIGLVDFQDFLSVYGDSVTLSGQRIREVLRDLDPQLYKDQIIELIAALESGAASVEQALALLGQSQSDFAKRFLEIVNLFRSGKITIESLQKQVSALTDLFPDAAASDLAEEIARLLAQGGGR